MGMLDSWRGYVDRGRGFLRRSVDETSGQVHEHAEKAASTLARAAAIFAGQTIKGVCKLLLCIAAVLFSGNMIWNTFNEGIEERNMARLTMAVEACLTAGGGANGN